MIYVKIHNGDKINEAALDILKIAVGDQCIL